MHGLLLLCSLLHLHIYVIHVLLYINLCILPLRNKFILTVSLSCFLLPSLYLYLTWYSKLFFSFLMSSATVNSGVSHSSPSMASSLSPHTFNSPISLKLDEDNFLIWKHQVLATIDGLQLMRFLDGSPSPPKYVDPEAETSATVNSVYLHHHQQDRLIVAWLLASMSNTMLTKMVGLNTSHQIWQKLNVYYTSQSRARIKKLKTQLKSTKKDKSISVYVLDIKKLVDALAAIGSPITEDDHIEYILDGLPEDYDGFVTSILSRHEPYTVEEIEALLLAQEEWFEKHRSTDILPQANVSTSSWTSSSQGRVSERGGRSRSRSSSNRGGRSFPSRQQSRQPWQPQQSSSQTNNRVQCQFCSKFGHLVAECWHRFNRDFQPQIQMHNSQVSSTNSDVYDQLSNVSCLSDPLWYPDSGASHHITNDTNNYNTKTSYTGSEHIKLGNDAGLQIAHLGSTNLSSTSRSSCFVLNKLLHVPTVTKNLLSVSQFARDNKSFL